MKGSAQALGALIESADMQFVDRPARPMGLTVSKASIRRPRPMGIVVHQHQDRLLHNSIWDFTVQFYENEWHPTVAKGSYLSELGTGPATMAAIDGQERAWA